MAHASARPFAHLRAVVREELGHAQPASWAPRLLLAPLPDHVGCRVRTGVLRAFGWRIGHGSLFLGTPKLYGNGRLVARLDIGAGTIINRGCTLELEDQVHIGAQVSIGHDVLILTSTHRIGRATRRAGRSTAAPVVVGDGAWIGARCVILPGVTVGAGAVVAAGSTVAHDVPDHALVSGVPATGTVARLPG
jgi:acetyltransferase-like isoleucine patch superfamily enzyme